MTAVLGWLNRSQAKDSLGEQFKKPAIAFDCKVRWRSADLEFGSEFAAH